MDSTSLDFGHVLVLLQNQLKLAPPDFFRDAIAKDETAVRPALARVLEAARDRPRLRAGAAELFAFLQRRFGLWSTHKTLDAAVRAAAFDAEDDRPVECALPRPLVAVDAVDPSACDLAALGYPTLAAHQTTREDPLMTATRLLDAPAADSGLLADPTLAQARTEATAFLEALAANMAIS